MDATFKNLMAKFDLRKNSKENKSPEEIALYFYNEGKKIASEEVSSRKEYAFTYECDHCGHEIENWTLDLTDGDEIRIPVWNLAQTSFDCPKCGAEYGTGDIDVVEFNGPDEDYSDDSCDDDDEEDDDNGDV